MHDKYDQLRIVEAGIWAKANYVLHENVKIAQNRQIAAGWWLYCVQCELDCATFTCSSHVSKNSGGRSLQFARTRSIPTLCYQLDSALLRLWHVSAIQLFQLGSRHVYYNASSTSSNVE